MFDLFCSGFTNQATVVTAHIINDRFIKTVTTDTHRRRVNHAIERDHRHFRRTTTDINHH
ncbi:Uncharacterised protein [Vibrio cholerae]|uniref:Uncharacterized protein n=1 Tax=Vibrio cholerae TaxID=666 RepID=A0A656AC64_VIBCL|nr:Uncharacterised protein [Vibrio cholerae]CSC39867.1 Uncharacterised protein [Vibrio cholerae]CSD01501.1 Uncharacterised protein [Vibrio cholerae]